MSYIMSIYYNKKIYLYSSIFRVYNIISSWCCSISMTVGSLLGKGAVEVVDPTLSAGRFYSTLFLAPKTEGRMRPVINLKALNFWVQPQHFKMEGIHMLQEIVVEGKWLAKLDLKDAYFTVPIVQEHQKYLHFAADEIRYQLYFVRFATCNTGISFLLHNIQQF